MSKTSNTPSQRLRATALCALLAALPYSANASLLGHLAAKAIESQVGDKIKDTFAVEQAAPVALPPAGSFDACAHIFPGGRPFDIQKMDQQWRPVALCSGNYAVVYSKLTKTPLLVFERLSKAQLSDALNESRTDVFYPDPRLKRGERAELSDFVGSQLDRGHMSPAANSPDQVGMAQSFVLSNMIPQDPQNNRKTWAKIESDTRKYGRRADGYVYVISGPQFKGSIRHIGANRVWVPSHLFKLVHDEASGRSWAHLLPNTAEATVGRPVDYAEFVKQTGWQLLVNTNAVAAR